MIDNREILKFYIKIIGNDIELYKLNEDEFWINFNYGVGCDYLLQISQDLAEFVSKEYNIPIEPPKATLFCKTTHYCNSKKRHCESADEYGSCKVCTYSGDLYITGERYCDSEEFFFEQLKRNRDLIMNFDKTDED